KDIGLTPSAEGGYEVSTVVPAEIAQSYGLQPGDRIISVNGKPVGNPSEDVQIIQEIKTSKEATVQIQRGNQLTTVSIPIVF
ncbi:MAG: PDZ domain-containing protein, partial [Pseudomonadota bacterium]|nr:PDZ domain-containing protein [Pseudomonadota bacterium]